MKTVSKKLGNRRLRELVKILKAAHARYRRKNMLSALYMSEEGYYQGSYDHACGGFLKRGSGWGPKDQEKEFALSAMERDELFSATGCGGATTALEAANYILRFVKKREKRINDARGAVA